MSFHIEYRVLWLWNAFIQRGCRIELSGVADGSNLEGKELQCVPTSLLNAMAVFVNSLSMHPPVVDMVSLVV